MSTFKMGKLLLNSLFKKPATKISADQPIIKKDWFERTRGSIDITVEDCIKCGMCQRKCPTNAITVSRDESFWEIQRMQCIQCGCCVEVCPKKCLHMNDTYTAPNVVKVVDKFDIPVQEKPAAKAEGGAAAGGDGLTCNMEECVFCGLCAKTCPVDALTVDRGEKKWEVDKDTCIQCGACVDKCPKKCLSL